jgi:hypothetical protein
VSLQQEVHAVHVKVGMPRQYHMPQLPIVHLPRPQQPLLPFRCTLESPAVLLRACRRAFLRR